MPVHGIFNFYMRTAGKYDGSAKRKRVRSTRDLYLRWFRETQALLVRFLFANRPLSVVHANVRTVGPRFRRSTCEMRVADRSNSI